MGGQYIFLPDRVPLLEAKLGIEPGFLDSLDDENESDWSFVIKVHALIEAAVAHLLTQHLQRPELDDLFAHLELSGAKTGKVAFAETLGLLEKSERRFIRSFSELRNKLVHDVRNVSFDLAEHVEAMTLADKNKFLNNFNLLSSDVTDQVRNIFRFDPRQALWYSAMALLGKIYLKLPTIDSA